MLAPLMALYGVACSAGGADSGRLAPYTNMTASYSGGTASAPVETPFEDASVHVRFELAETGPPGFGSVPFPDDLYRDGAGYVRVAGTLGDSALAAALQESMGTLDGFGVHGPVFFELDGDIDPATIPQSAEASLDDAASVFLIDVDTNSATAFQRIPVSVTWDGDARRLLLVPQSGTALVPRRRYAAVITNRLLDEAGDAVGPSEDFARIRMATASIATPLAEAARSNYAPVLDALSQRSLPRAQVVGLAVFRVQSVAAELEEALDRVRDSGMAGVTAATEVTESALDDVLGEAAGQIGFTATGVSHANLASMVHGTIESPVLLSKTAFVHGAFGRDEAGMLAIRRVENVPFTIFLPHTMGSDEPLPVVFYLHGAGGERGDALALADRFAASNFAVIALDAPYHGQRDETGDVSNRFTGQQIPDGFGDGAGDFFGVTDDAGALSPGHPFYYRDALRQWALEHVHLLDVARAGGFGGLSLPALDFSRVALLGMDVGVDAALMVAGLGDGIEVVAGAFSGGPVMQTWLTSPAQQERTAALLKPLGVSRDINSALLSPQVAFMQMLLDRADPMAWATVVNRKAVNVLLLSVEGDEVTSNRSSQSLGGALGAEAGEPLGATVGYPEGVTHSFVALGAGAHNTLLSVDGERLFKASDVLPAQRLDKPETLANPTDSAQLQMLRFVESWRACVDAGMGGPCRALLSDGN